MTKFKIIIISLVIISLTGCFSPPHSSFTFNKTNVNFKDSKIAVQPVMPTFDYDGSCVSKEDLQLFGSHFAEDLSLAIKGVLGKNKLGFDNIEIVKTGRIETCPCEYEVSYYNGQQVQPITIYDRDKKIVECAGTINTNKIFHNGPTLLNEHRLNFSEYSNDFDYILIIIPIRYWVRHIPLMDVISYNFIYAIYNTKSGQMIGIGQKESDYCEDFSICNTKMANEIVEEIIEATNGEY